MKRHWETDELVEHWTLLPRETELLTNKTGATRLGFAVLLKFFQLEAYFPQQASAVSTVAVEFIAKQVKVAPEQFERYQWRGRTIEYHRAQIRKLHGFRETTVDDAQALSHWQTRSHQGNGRRDTGPGDLRRQGPMRELPPASRPSASSSR
jgi:hypothetical protein